MTRRILIFHYHLFKNAGSSIDVMLRHNFGERWAQQEFSGPMQKKALAVAEFVANRPDLAALSSHTAYLPAPRVEGLEVFPILFIRHPIDRLRSAYEFERLQSSEMLTAKLAKSHDFGGYFHELLKVKGHRHVVNSQTWRLAHNTPAKEGTELERAIRALDELPFVGLVEAFEDSVCLLETKLRRHFPHFHALVSRTNAMSGSSRLNERLALFRDSLGGELYDEVCAVNSDDLKIHEILTTRMKNAHCAISASAGDRFGSGPRGTKSRA
jgi:hypothetical protein